MWDECEFECVPEEVNLVDGWEHYGHLADTLETNQKKKTLSKDT